LAGAPVVRTATPPLTPHRPFFYIGHGENDDLQAQGCLPWVYYAATLLQLVDRTNQQKRSVPLTFRLDTGAFTSAIPEEWVHTHHLRPLLGPLSTPVKVGGVSGTANGPIARGVHVRFCTDLGRVYPFDFLVLRSLNRGGKRKQDPFGLISLRDIANHFATLNVEGEFVLDSDGYPIAKPELVLIPR
jgi:hypothetical protein